jgi:hypothetical protein
MFYNVVLIVKIIILINLVLLWCKWSYFRRNNVLHTELRKEEVVVKKRTIGKGNTNNVDII